MEGFKFNPKKETKSQNLELKKLVNEASDKVKLAFQVLLIGSMSMLADKALAQVQNEFKSSENGVGSNKIEWQVDINEQKKIEVEKSILQQQAWLKDYINSEKSRERLTKECLRYDEIMRENPEMSYEEFINSPKFKAFEVSDEGDTIKITNYLEGITEYRGNSYREMDTEEFHKIIEGATLDKLLPEPKIENLSQYKQEAMKERVNDIIETRIDVLENGPVVVVKSIKNERGKGKIVGQFNAEKQGTVFFRKDFKKFDVTTGVHEFTHRSTYGNQLINKATVFLLKNKAQSGDTYLNDPTEIHARINELRFLMEQEGIYKASLEDFEEKHFIKILKSNKIMNNFAIQQLIYTLSKNNLIWFMNNMADGSVSTISVENLA